MFDTTNHSNIFISFKTQTTQKAIYEWIEIAKKINLAKRIIVSQKPEHVSCNMIFEKSFLTNSNTWQ